MSTVPQKKSDDHIGLSFVLANLTREVETMIWDVDLLEQDYIAIAESDHAKLSVQTAQRIDRIQQNLKDIAALIGLCSRNSCCDTQLDIDALKAVAEQKVILDRVCGLNRATTKQSNVDLF